MKSYIKLQYRLILSYLAIILIPLVALGSVSFFVSLSVVKDQTILQDNAHLQQISTNVDGVITHMKNTSLIAYSSTLLQQYIQKEDVDNLELRGDANINNYLYSLKSADYDNYTFIMKSYNSGTIYCNNYDYLIDETYDFDHLYWIQKAIALTDATVFVPTYIPTYYKNDATPVFSIARQLNDNYTLVPLGYIIINCDASVIDDIVTDDIGQVYIVDEYDNLVYPYDLATLPIVPEGDGNELQRINNQQYLVSRYNSNETGLKYLKITPYSDISRNANMIIKITLIMVLVVIILSLFVSFALSQNISTPINRLILNMDRMNNDLFEESIVETNIYEIHELNGRFNKMMQRINTHIQEEYLSAIRKKDIEYKLLQSQISPHFLFNTLESIRMMAAINDDDETAVMIYNLANLYRYSIRITTSLVPLEEEIKHINNYVLLQKMRFGDKFDFITDIDPNSLSCELPHLTLQPMIENALSHGFSSKESGGIIRVTTTFRSNQLTIIISDNGHGINDLKLTQLKNKLGKTAHEGHIGLLATYERIKYHFKDSQVTIDSTEGIGTSITIIINYGV